jgi:dihydropteroate synthase
MRQAYTWVLPRIIIKLGERTAIMGVLNVTPDSFSDGGVYFDQDRAIARGKEIEQQGADILDVGGESTRPGGDPVSEDEEMRRVLPVIEKLAGSLRIPISIDTYRSRVAKRALEAGAQIVNDISGFRFDDELAGTVKSAGAAVVLMHSRGERYQLHGQSPMADPLGEITTGLMQSIGYARSLGIAESSIMIDPGIGFGKNAEESFNVLKNLSVFSKLQYPLLVGTSRKSFIRTVTQDNFEARIWGTAATVATAILNGAHVVRVHDIEQMRVVADVTDRILASHES